MHEISDSTYFVGYIYIISLSSAEFVHSIASVNFYLYLRHCTWHSENTNVKQSRFVFIFLFIYAWTLLILFKYPLLYLFILIYNGFGGSLNDLSLAFVHFLSIID